MGSISHLTSHIASLSDINTDFSRPSHSFIHEQRLCSNMPQSCCEYLERIPKIVGEFLAHRYADTRMFIRAFSSIFGSTTRSEIERRIYEIHQFRAYVEDYQNTGQRVNRQFERLSPQAQSLFFYTNTDYMTQLRHANDTIITLPIRSEIMRECDRIISFQRMLIIVNTFYRAFTRSGGSSHSGAVSSAFGATEAVSSASGATEEGFGFGSLWHRIFGFGGMPVPREGGEEAVSTGTVPAATLPGVDLNIPNTVPYVRNSIPADVQRKANEIDGLRARFAGVRPNAFEDIAMADFISIPVFDASHPMVQTGLAGLRAALTTPGADIRAALSNHRNGRHLVDKDSLEAHIAAGSSWAPAKCMLCRHPEHGGIRREALRIDTGLQDEILEFLRANVPAVH